MARTVINLASRENSILDAVKAKHGLESKSQALSLILRHYERNELEPQLRPEFIREIEEAGSSGKFVEVKDFAKQFGLE